MYYLCTMKINYNKHIWEGWTVQGFIDNLEISFKFKKTSLKTREDVKKWCMSEQSYYKKYIPEVVNHFCNILNIK